MKNKELIKELYKFNPDSEIVITGDYESKTTSNIFDIYEVDRINTDVHILDKISEKIIIISTDICSG